MIPAWAAEYIGLPFSDHGRTRDGVDCWGLVRLVLAEQFGFDVPSHDGSYRQTTDRDDLDRLISTERSSAWSAVPAGSEQAGDVVLLRCLGAACHVGLVVTPGIMIHAEVGL
ncbi:C40 family peptidase, partial [Insolitispirillum peregrinum]|uniref:C40 family peptidase n=1 Tax=Insolitispirillum peregrinum TaxID=80876 RepID=UPI00361BE06B